MSRFKAKKQQAYLGVPLPVRWQIRNRLEELSIDAICSLNGDLVVEVDNAVTIAQIHSVARQFVESRQTLASWLEVCWAQPSYSVEASL